jgi:hypothetical protein
VWIDAGRFIGWQQRDRGCADAHQRHRQQKHEAPSDAVADGSKDRSTNRPHRKADREAAIGADQRGERIVGREEQPRQHRREIAVESEIVPFEQIADAACGQRRRREPRAFFWAQHGACVKRVHLCRLALLLFRAFSEGWQSSIAAYLCGLQQARDPTEEAGERNGGRCSGRRIRQCLGRGRY